MRVRMLQTEIGRVQPDGPKVHCRRGEDHDVHESVARVWLERGIAERVREPRRAAKDDKGD